MTYTRVQNYQDDALRDDMIRRDADGAFIPADPDNTDWQAYQAWLKAGNKPAEAESQPTSNPSAATVRNAGSLRRSREAAAAPVLPVRPTTFGAE